ncbi:MAG: radical SAM protein [Candidatus Omnitrophica bacterium]|nr:radical SAM protein [Candidatus Omnitrophota bacterium]
MDIKEIRTQRALSRTQIKLADFVINPYRGCEFGCKYCYSRENKNVKKRTEPWGSFLDVKIDAPFVLEKELRFKRPKCIMLGSTTECFQPREEEFKVTRALLEIIKSRNIPVVILTKSNLIEKYVDLLNYNPNNKIYFTFMFQDKAVKDILEKDTPELEKRIKAIKKLIENKIRVKIHVGPFIPFMEDLRKLFQFIPPGIKEVEIEVYNSKMGNFKEIVSLIKERISKEKSAALAKTYSSGKDYNNFCTFLRKEAQKINEDYNFKLNFIVPEFDSWYTDKIKYE